ncbi:MAG TPA: DUF3143 domain-containing protein [Cyanobacteria bacterium UBA8803]|nr:DUF3143 domain-containing protein [Cyanobacteria bacterium UBA9273]HBL60256.1 DUF3143 domain-containing protein [Cyanobacteria bacterium UBA8803]
MVFPPDNTPLYNHPLHEIEQWLQTQGCEQDRNNLHCWHVERPTWKAQLCLDVEELTVRYINAAEGGRDILRSFKYSLSRADVEAAVFSGP